MAIVYARLIELGIIIIVGGAIFVIVRIKDNLKYKKEQKDWIENSFEFNGGRYNKKYAHIENGKIVHDL